MMIYRKLAAGNPFAHGLCLAALAVCGAGNAALAQTPPLPVAMPATANVVPAVQKPAPAVGNTFLECDGYNRPKASSDSFITSRDLFNLFNVTDQDVRQSGGLVLSADGVAYCDTALADPALTDKMTARRVNLLHAKAHHQMIAGDNAGALITLERAHAIKLDIPDDMRADGFDVSNAAESALALIRLGRVSDAKPIIDHIEHQRPYAIAVVNLADSLRSVVAPSLEAEIVRAKARTPQVANMAFRGLNLAFLARRMDDVAYLGEGLTLTLPNTDRWRVDGQNQAKYTYISNRAALAGTVAYAETVLGKADMAAARIKTARAALALALTPPTPPEGGGAIPKRQQQDFDVRKSWGTQGSAILDAWEQAIAIRQRAPGMTVGEVLAATKGIHDFPAMALADLAGVAKSSTPSDTATAAGMNRAVQGSIAQALAKETRLEPADLMKLLPRPEVWANQVSNSGYDGFRCSLPDCARHGGEFEYDALDLPGRMSVRFSSNEATVPTVQEYAVLMAASLAKTKAFDSFIIEYALTVNRTMYSGGGSSNAGREYELVVRLFNKGNLPEDLTGAQWRAFDASKVLADFAARPGGGDRKPH